MKRICVTLEVDVDDNITIEEVINDISINQYGIVNEVVDIYATTGEDENAEGF